MNLLLLALFALGYACGLLNGAWLLNRLARHADLRSAGSGNLGARNLYDVTGSAWLAILAAIIDAAKGALAVLLAMYFCPGWYAAAAFAAVGVVVGHNYNALLGWKGGRGLATALGAGLVISPPFVVTWLFMYGVGYAAIRRNIHIASMTATIATAFIALSVPSPVFTATTWFVVPDVWQMRWTIVAMLFPVFHRFIQPVREYILSAESSEADD
ncbi:MAG: glycerol-3-phosphate acyltransferase [Bradyrhizobiaceae bacterium]|nr:glycerol-3-phosphate acyltransferase [Bradyrhizobiaceae bacterium]